MTGFFYDRLFEMNLMDCHLCQYPDRVFFSIVELSVLRTPNYRERAMTTNLDIKILATPMLTCYGASQRLAISGEPTSPWVEHGVYIDAPPGKELPYQTNPEPREIQTLSKDGCTWLLVSPEDGEEKDVVCWICSEFTAPPYGIQMRLGHFLCKFGYTQPIPAQVIDEQLECSVEVVSAFTEKTIKGIKTRWSVDGLFITFDRTGESGISRFKHTFQEAGEHIIAVSFENEFDGSVAEHKFPVMVYEKDPWEFAEIKVNEVIQPRGVPIVLHYERSNTVTVEVAPEIAAKLLLELVDIKGTQIDFPKGWQDPVGKKFEFELTPEVGKGGSFTAVFASKEVARTLELAGRVVSEDLANNVDVVIEGKLAPLKGNVFFRDFPYTAKFVSKAGSAITDLPAFLTFKVVSGGIGDDDLISKPGVGQPNKDQVWDFSGSRNSGLFDAIFSCFGVSKPIVIKNCILVSSSIEVEADIVLDEDGSDYFWRGETRQIKLVAKPGSPMDLVPKALRWVSGTNITKPDVPCNPSLDVMSTTKSWDITPSMSKSGTMLLDLIFEGSPNPATLTTYTVVSRNHADEVDVELDGNAVMPGTKFKAGQLHKLSVTPKQYSPYAWMPVSLNWSGSADLTAANFKCQPSFGVPGMKFFWDITGDQGESGKFNLSLKWVQLPTPMSLNDLEMQ